MTSNEKETIAMGLARALAYRLSLFQPRLIEFLGLIEERDLNKSCTQLEFPPEFKNELQRQVQQESNQEDILSKITRLKRFPHYYSIVKNLRLHKRRYTRRYLTEGNPPKPKSAFLYFFQDQRTYIMDKFPGMKAQDLFAVIAQKYRMLSSNEKQPYIKKSLRDRTLNEKRLQDLSLENGEQFHPEQHSSNMQSLE